MRNTVIKPLPKEKIGFRFSLIHKFVPFLIIIMSMAIASNNVAKELNYDVYFVGQYLFTINKIYVYPFWAPGISHIPGRIPRLRRILTGLV